MGHDSEIQRAKGLKGGPARARSLSAERRTEIAKLAAGARWEDTKNPDMKIRRIKMTNEEYKLVKKALNEFRGLK